ncbi:MAG: penicillin-binding protein, partial [Deltaproteobacteria bacterium]|nr:penicillin-binding protein [Deltaproteobacteria bacterium]
PSRYSPFNHPDEARRRQVYAISRLLENGYISKEQAETAKAEKLQFRERPNVTLSQAPYFAEHVRRYLEDKFGEERLYSDGFRVRTTVNIEQQIAAENAVEKGLLEFAKRREYRGPSKKLSPDQVEAFLKKQENELLDEPLLKGRVIDAVVSAVDVKTGAVKVHVGRSQGTINKKETNWVLTRGQPIQKILAPGDVVYVQALDHGQEAGTWLFSLEQHPLVQGALMSLDLRDGAVKSMVGGRDFKESQFNRTTQSRGHPGSALRPIIYTAAMDNGYTPGSIISDEPVVYDDLGSRQKWKPTNFDHKFYGPTDLYTGLVQSRNVMAVKLLHRVGFKAVIETARNLGITSPMPESLAMALGANGVSLAEMVTAFSTFPNMGERVEPMFITRIEDRDGQLVEEFRPRRIKAISSGTACVLTYMLLGVVNQGTGTRVRTVGRPCGGKTGTTNDLADAWFIGFTPEYVTGVWVGLDEMKPMGVGESGGKAAAPIFAYYMEAVLKGKPVRDFPVPPDATLVNNGSASICYKAGTVGTGLSEAPPAGGDDFLKSDFDDKEL